MASHGTARSGIATGCRQTRFSSVDLSPSWPYFGFPSRAAVVELGPLPIAVTAPPLTRTPLWTHQRSILYSTPHATPRLLDVASRPATRSRATRGRLASMKVRLASFLFLGRRKMHSRTLLSNGIKRRKGSGPCAAANGWKFF